MSRTLLLTRARNQAEAFAVQVTQNTDFKPHICPMQEMQDIPAQINFDGVDALVFTSTNGVKSFVRRWDIRNIPAFCVGEATAKIARSAGFVAFAAKGNAGSLATIVNAARVTNPLHIHGQHKASDLPIKGQSLAIYDQIALTMDAETQRLLGAGKIDAVVLFSPRSARLLADVWPGNAAAIDIYCISAATAKPMAALGNIRISDVPSAESVLALLKAG